MQMQMQMHSQRCREELRLTCGQHIGDTKAGTLIGIDRFGNKYFENLQEELPLRTRWVDFKQYEWDPYVPPFPSPLLPFSPSLQTPPLTSHPHQQLAHRARLARLDLLHGRRAAAARQADADGPARLGAARAPPEPDLQPRRLQDVQHRQEQDQRLGADDCGAIDGWEERMDGWGEGRKLTACTY